MIHKIMHYVFHDGGNWDMNSEAEKKDYDFTSEISEEAKADFIKFLKELKEVERNCSVVSHTNHSNHNNW